MKKINLILLVSVLYTSFGLTQSIVNNSSYIYVSNGTVLTFAKDYENLGDGQIMNNGNVDVMGNWINNGTNGGNSLGYTGYVNFKGSLPQTITGSAGTEFNNLKLEQDVKMFSDVTVWDELELTGGKLNIKNNDLNYQGWNGIIANSSYYIVAQESGKLTMFVDMMTPAVFPVGTYTTYNPATIALNSASDSYSMNLIPDVLTNGYSGTTIPDIDDCVNLTWNIDADMPDFVDCNLTVQWIASQEGSSFDRAQSSIGGYYSGQWNANSVQTISGSNPYALTLNNIQHTGNFAVGDLESPMAITLALNVDLTAFLEGPYNSTEMITALNVKSYLPLTQPYNVAPWNYAGGESVAAIPNADVVDWVLVETRDAATASDATPATMLERHAAFVLKDGSIVATDGSSNLQFTSAATQNLYVVIYHRNHLSIMSANALTENGGVYSYNFTTGAGQAYSGTAAGQKEIATGIYGMYGGDGSGGGDITNYDYIYVWKPAAGENGYRKADFNMDGQVENKDKNDIWLGNINVSTQVPE